MFRENRTYQDRRIEDLEKCDVRNLIGPVKWPDDWDHGFTFEIRLIENDGQGRVRNLAAMPGEEIKRLWEPEEENEE